MPAKEMTAINHITAPSQQVPSCFKCTLRGSLILFPGPPNLEDSFCYLITGRYLQRSLLPIYDGSLATNKTVPIQQPLVGLGLREWCVCVCKDGQQSFNIKTLLVCFY